MSVNGRLAAFAVRYAFNQSADRLIGWLDDHFTDHSRALPLALARATSRAWQAVGLALAGDGWFDRLRDRDLTTFRDQIRAFLAATPTGLDGAAPGLRARACDELTRLRRSGRLGAPASRDALAADARRYGATSDLLAGAEAAVAAAAAAVAADAPNLAQVLRLRPAGGPPLLAAAFVFFFRREVEANDDLARGLTFGSLRALTAAQDAGFALLADRAGGILDQIDVLFDALGTWFAAADGKLDDIRARLDQLLDNRNVPTGPTDALKVSVTNEKELAQLRRWRDEMRHLPPELLDAADWSKLGDALAAGGLFEEARQAQAAAAANAKAADDQVAEAEAEYKLYRTGCEQERWADALAALVRATELDPARFAPFPLTRYEPVSILGAGGFGTVFHCRDRLTKGRDVAVKSLHTADMVRDLETVFAEAQLLAELSHPHIVKVFNWDFADPTTQSRPYIVMEHYPGESLAAHLKRSGPLPVAGVVSLARQIAEAMQAAHRANVLHRDLKPGNILVCPVAGGDDDHGYEAKVIDFGMAVRAAAVAASVSTSAPHRTRRDQSFAGTLEYAAPEQKGKLAGVPVGRYSDVYAFGRTMQEALFRTTDPKTPHWKTLPADMRDALQSLLETATTEELSGRFRDFDPILKALRALDPAEMARSAADERRREMSEWREQEAELERDRQAVARAELKRREEEVARKEQAAREAERRVREEAQVRKQREEATAQKRREAEEAQKRLAREQERKRQEAVEVARRQAAEAEAEAGARSPGEQERQVDVRVVVVGKPEPQRGRVATLFRYLLASVGAVVVVRVAIYVLVAGGTGRFGRPAELPNPIVGNTKYDYQPLADSSLIANIRNTGGSGQVKVEVHVYRDNQRTQFVGSWPHSLYLNKGEEKAVSIRLGGLREGKGVFAYTTASAE